MADEQVKALIEKVRKKLNGADFSNFTGRFAVQINLTGKVEGVFYIEILDGVLSVEPYEYIDKTGAVSITKTNFERLLLNGRIGLDSPKIEKVEGDKEKLSQFFALFAK